jgi:hypothetical protein
MLGTSASMGIDGDGTSSTWKLSYANESTAALAAWQAFNSASYANASQVMEM